jgi:hypothetical protein
MNLFIFIFNNKFLLIRKRSKLGTCINNI